MKHLTYLLLATAITSCATKQTQLPQIQNGTVWLDTNGDTIEAHSGGILQVDSIYYWYGENHAKGVGNQTGVSCYSSTDLFHWKNEGVALPKDSLPVAFHDSGVCERPKVIYNKKTNKYVMWMHLDARGYTVAAAGVAIANNPAGPFTFLGYKRPIAYNYGYNGNGGASEGLNEQGLGNSFRDMTLFVDDNNEAYVFYASENNTTQYCARLNADYTDIEMPAELGKTWQRTIVAGNREAPSIFKFRGRYYQINSGLTGWAPNPAEWAWADTILGTWHRMPNPCVGIGAETTFQSQSAFVVQAPGKADSCFILMADRWDGAQLQNSTYVWIPFIVDAKNITLYNINAWDKSVFNHTNLGIEKPKAKLRANNKLEWTKVDNAAAYNVYKNSILIATTSNCFFEIPAELAGRAFNYSVTAFNITGCQSVPSLPLLVEFNKPTEVQLSALEPDAWKQGWGTLQKNKAMNQSPINIAGRIFETGLGSHAHSEITYNIGGQYSSFQAFVGIDNYPSFCTNCATAAFMVKVDGNVVFQTPIMHITDSAVFVNVNLKNANTLTLIATDGGNGAHYDHINWANAKLIP